jgi:hypothetical protein
MVQHLRLTHIPYKLSVAQSSLNLIEHRIVSEEIVWHRIPITYIGARKQLTVNILLYFVVPHLGSLQNNPVERQTIYQALLLKMTEGASDSYATCTDDFCNVLMR